MCRLRSILRFRRQSLSFAFGLVTMTTARLIIAGVVLLFAAYIVAMNWGCVIVSLRNRKRGIDRHHSTVPIASLIFAGMGHMIWPWPDKSWIIAIPLLDIANWSLLWLPVAFIREKRMKSIAEPGAAPNGGPAPSVDNPNAPGGPPSVS
jgi:hypothetical protein